MNRINEFGRAAIFALGLGLAAGAVNAQSTDGYHSIQVFPLVVNSASFAARYSFQNPNASPITIKVTYYPATGTPQAGVGSPLECNDVVVAAGKTATFLSLKVMCPNLLSGTGVGSQYGFLYTREVTADKILPFAGFSRISNPQGNGFTVEAFPASTFTSADTFVNGIRRMAATVSSPTFQTNCFVANLNEVNAPVSVSTKVQYTLYNSASAVIGGGQVTLAPGQNIRLLDIFTAGAAALGDYDDASVRFEELDVDPLNPQEPGILSFCTTQENTTFGADFRIAKQELGAGGLGYPGDVVGSQDNHVSRETLVSADGVGRQFEIGTGTSANTHVIYFRHPDYITCELVDAGNVRRVQSYGLEMRMLDQDGVAIAGGANVTGWGKFYMGDKTDRNGGSNTRYTIEVESNGLNTGVTRTYKLHCLSGSGHSLGDIIRYKDVINRF